jgi:hypothetical protein
MVSWVKVAVCFFYNVIKSFVRQIAGRLMGFTIHDDVLMIIIGWLLATKAEGFWKEFGEALIYGAAASLGAAGGLGILQLVAPPQQPQVAAPMAYAAVYPAVVEVG